MEKNIDFENKRGTERTDIPGWGIDADPENDPTYPMKQRTNEEHEGYSWDRPTQQSVDVEILHSNERPNVTAVFGTSTPPSGLSGAIRRFAFKHSENEYSHWLPLLLADRVNVVEGIIDDLKKRLCAQHLCRKRSESRMETQSAGIGEKSSDHSCRHLWDLQMAFQQR